MKRQQRSLVSLTISAAVALLAVLSLVAPAIADTFAQQKKPETSTQTTTEAAPEAPAEQPAPPAEEESAPVEEEYDEEQTFIEVWGERIDAFNAGYPLAGYGQTFAAAAYAYGVDPRYAPAIALVESGSGSNCTYSCNAWGWGARSWSDWDSAIWDYTGELYAGYGHTLSYSAALRYNELNPDGWYAEVESAMYQIWGDESL